MRAGLLNFRFFFFNDTATTEIYTLSLHDALPISKLGIIKADIGIRDGRIVGIGQAGNPDTMDGVTPNMIIGDRKSTRLNSSHANISYAVFCLKKKKINF